MRNFLIIFGGLVSFLLWANFIFFDFRKVVNPNSREFLGAMATAASIIWFSYIVVSGF